MGNIFDEKHYKIIHGFQQPDGSFLINNSIIEINNKLYGLTADNSTTNNYGKIYRCNFDGSEFEILYRFSGVTYGDGNEPSRNLLYDSVSNKIYGVTVYGGIPLPSFYTNFGSGGGTIFSYDLNSNNYQLLYAFSGRSGTSDDGACPIPSLIKINNKIYGGTRTGGLSSLPNGQGAGTIFEYDLTSNTYQILYRLPPDFLNGDEVNGLTYNPLTNKIYGVTYIGGNGPAGGVLFEMDLSGNYTVLHDFSGTTYNDGDLPNDALFLASNNVFYGVTQQGGSNNKGTIFSSDTLGNVGIIHHFSSTSFGGLGDGEWPQSSLTEFNNNGILYGTAFRGGIGTYGTVFSCDTTGNFGIVHRFRYPITRCDGIYSRGRLLSATNNFLYGTTYDGRSSGTIYTWINDCYFSFVSSGSTYPYLYDPTGTNYRYTWGTINPPTNTLSSPFAALFNGVYWANNCDPFVSNIYERTYPTTDLNCSPVLNRTITIPGLTAPNQNKGIAYPGVANRLLINNAATQSVELYNISTNTASLINTVFFLPPTHSFDINNRLVDSLYYDIGNDIYYIAFTNTFTSFDNVGTILNDGQAPGGNIISMYLYNGEIYTTTDNNLIYLTQPAPPSGWTFTLIGNGPFNGPMYGIAQQQTEGCALKVATGCTGPALFVEVYQTSSSGFCVTILGGTPKYTLTIDDNVYSYSKEGTHCFTGSCTHEVQFLRCGLTNGFQTKGFINSHWLGGGISATVFTILDLTVNGVQYGPGTPLMINTIPQDLVYGIGTDGNSYVTNITDWLNVYLEPAGVTLWNDMSVIDMPIGTTFNFTIQYDNSDPSIPGTGTTQIYNYNNISGWTIPNDVNYGYYDCVLSSRTTSIYNITVSDLCYTASTILDFSCETADNCAVTATTITGCTDIVIDVNAYNITCLHPGVIVVSVTGGCQPYTYTLYHPNITTVYSQITVSANTWTFANLTDPGDYYVSVESCDGFLISPLTPYTIVDTYTFYAHGYQVGLHQYCIDISGGTPPYEVIFGNIHTSAATATTLCFDVICGQTYRYIVKDSNEDAYCVNNPLSGGSTTHPFNEGGCIRGEVYHHPAGPDINDPQYWPAQQNVFPNWNANGEPGYQPSLLPYNNLQQPPLTYISLNQFALPDQPCNVGFPGYPNLIDWYQLEFFGIIHIPVSGPYRFSLGSDDGAIFSIILPPPSAPYTVNNDGMHALNAPNSPTITGFVNLTAGDYPFRMSYYQGPPYNIGLELKWITPLNPNWEYVPVGAFSCATECQCVITGQTTIICPPPTITISGTNACCYNNGSATININGGEPNFTLTGTNLTDGQQFILVTSASTIYFDHLTIGNWVFNITDLIGNSLIATITISDTFEIRYYSATTTTGTTYCFYGSGSCNTSLFFGGFDGNANVTITPPPVSSTGPMASFAVNTWYCFDIPFSACGYYNFTFTRTGFNALTELVLNYPGSCPGSTSFNLTEGTWINNHTAWWGVHPVTGQRFVVYWDNFNNRWTLRNRVTNSVCAISTNSPNTIPTTWSTTGLGGNDCLCFNVAYTQFTGTYLMDAIPCGPPFYISGGTLCPCISVSGTSTNPVCNQDCGGTITLTTDSQYPPYTFQLLDSNNNIINNGLGLPATITTSSNPYTFNNLCQGNYRVNVIDGRGSTLCCGSTSGTTGGGGGGTGGGGGGTGGGGGGTAWTGPVYDHIFIVWMENKKFTDIVNSPSAPYINNFLIANGTLFTQMYSFGQPSQPNYICGFAGQTCGITGNGDALGGSSTPSFGQPNLWTALNARNKTFECYVESLPLSSMGYGTDYTLSPYAGKHDPARYFNQFSQTAVRKPYTDLTTKVTNGTLGSCATVVYIIPNLSNDMHNNGVPSGDNFLQTPTMQGVINYCGLQGNNSLFVLYFDEGDITSHDNRIAVTFYGNRVKTNTQVTTQYGTPPPMVAPWQNPVDNGHFFFTRTILSMYGAQYIGNTGNSNITDMTGWWI